MPISYIDTDNSGPFTKHTLSKLITSFLDPEDPSPAIRKSLRLAHVLLLSDHLSLAHQLIDALSKHADHIVPQRPYQTSPLISSLALENFWTSHPEYPQPPNPQYVTRDLARNQWGKYRECTRTGWMLEHCKLPEPANPHIWQKTDDPIVLAMCCRLLAKDKTAGQYPSQERMREALEVAKKLYAQPQVPVTAWKFERGVRRHGELLYWRLVVELAIRVGELETAADVLGMGLRLDGFNTSNGSDVTEYLALPDIWDVLPLLAKRGKEANPFYIEQEDAEVLVKEVIQAIELRARNGRQWSLAPEKVGWEEMLRRLSVGAWKVNRPCYKRNGIRRAEDILYPPATEEEIEAAEKEFGELPADFKDMVRIANGFQGGWHFLSGGIAGIRNLTTSTDQDLDNVASDFDHLGMKQDGVLSDEIIQLEPGNECDCFQHYIIPPKTWKENIVGRQVKNGEYQYWNAACWQPEMNRYDSVRDWVACCVEEVEMMVARGEVADQSEGEDEDEDNDDSDNDEDDEPQSGQIEEGDGVSEAVEKEVR
ncbi:hypothetical protein LSUB1_G007763 [Lachnellula subtilissima]|uniref:Knr4/Smi1-like domain-containing protein n=1 Tax=Lachnellula subtilissima TaxID=602034 RepID=A0A8H8RFT3_9HELO|nr:hypothetical protein LSUB1_G007763 [Lachnellula subtilissima]